MAQSACGGAAGSVARVSVSRGEASGRRPARAGIPRRSDGFFGGRAKADCGEVPRIIKTRGPPTCLPVGSKPESVGDVDSEPKRGIDTGRTAAGRPVRSIRKNIVLPGSGPTDLHFGKNDLVLSGVERTGPPSGGPARVARCGRAGGGRERGADRATKTRSAETDESASMIGPAGLATAGTS